MKLLTRYALSAAVLSLCALAACGNPSSNDPASGRTLVVDKAFDLKTADPARNFETTGNILGRATYDTLVTFKPGDSSTPVPQLATEWKSNADATTYTFRLREGVTFTNGDALTAEDVVFSLMRVKNIKANGAFLMDGLTVRAVDPQTVKITSDKPNAAIPSIMSSPTLGILNSKAVREKGGTDAEGADKADTAETFLNTTSAGSGPFMLESFSTTTETNLVPNPKYWGARPPFPKVVLRNASAATQVQDLTSGNAHVALDIGSDQVSSLKGNSSLEINTTPSPTVIFLFANANPKISAVTSNAAFREAIKYGVDYDSLLDLAGAGAVRASSMIPNSFLGALEEGAATKRDTARAAAAVKKLGSTSDITLEYPSDVTVGGLKLGPIAERLQANLAEIGLKIKLAPAPISTALDHYRGGTEEMGLWLWNPDFPDPADYLVFGPGDIVGKRAGWQVSDAPDVAKVATTARTTADETERATLYKNFMTGINEAAVINPLFQPSATIVASKSLPKVTFSPVYVLDITTIGQ